MQFSIIILTRNRSGVIESVTQEFDGETLRIGRTQDNDIVLPDPRLLEHQATFRVTKDGLEFESYEQAITRIDGENAVKGLVQVGTRIDLGAYKILLRPSDTSEGQGITLVIEQTTPLKDGLENMLKGGALSLSDTWLSLRGFSWLAFLGVLGLVFLWPYIEAESTRSVDVTKGHLSAQGKVLSFWQPGKLSHSHRFIGTNCTACHADPFSRVSITSCTNCHNSVEHHVDPFDIQLPELQQARCTSCHEEHLNQDKLADIKPAFCVACHNDIKSRSSVSELLNVSGFSTAHPEFRVLRKDAIGSEIRKIAEETNIRFPHHVHTAEKGILSPEEKTNKRLFCIDCHTLEPGGKGMAPINMKQHCQSCHQLKLTTGASGGRILPHGDVAGVHAMVKDSITAEQFGKARDQVAYILSDQERKDGSKVTKQYEAAYKGIKPQVNDRLHFVFNSVCGECHKVVAPKKPGQSWSVQSVIIPDHWLRKGDFVHKSHTDALKCEQCHVKSRTSNKSSDILIPGIASCRNCHGAEGDNARTPSACISCHKFHTPGAGSMTEVGVKP